VRPLPEPRSPRFILLGLGFAVLLGAVALLRKAQEPELRRRLRASLPAYAYVAHAFVAVLLLVVAPLVIGALTSFFAGRGRDLSFVGLANYADILGARGGELFAPGSFWLVLAVTLLWTAGNLVLHVALGVSIALVLSRITGPMSRLYRVLLILPWAVPSYVTALAWKGMFHRQFGAVNALLVAVGVEPISWFARFGTAFSANLATNAWLGFPFMMVVTLGALTAIPKETYEAAAVDGAGPLDRLRFITLPMIRPVLVPAVAMGAVWTFNMFNVIFLVSGGEPDGTTEILVSEAYRWAFTRSSQYGYAAAYAVLIFGILLLGTRLMSPWLEEKRA
jgi:arabinogalactan oligomer/maltooligosaccharide transport system permease protein